MSFAFSWITLGMVVAYFVAFYQLIAHIKSSHPDLHDRFGGRRVWYSLPDQLRFFGFLFGFRYLRFDDRKLVQLSVLTKVLFFVCAYCIITMPIYLQARL